MSVPVLVDGSGRKLSVGMRLGAGGEGSVYALSPTEAAKIYTLAPTAQRIAKLEALVRVASPEVRAIAAWPQHVLRERSGRATGFTMPRIDGRVRIATAMNPGSRKATFPQASWGWLIHVGRNLAAATEAVHRTGVVIGDVNDSNFLVGGDTFVRLIDVDSFQVRDGSQLYACDVGIPAYQPPELFGRSYAGLERTADHDRFGLAVLVFQLVFMGRHPWAGLWKGPDYAFDTGEIIARLPFAFGRDAAAAGFRPPEKTVRLDWLPAPTAELFERAFAKNGGPRPTGAEWGATLAEFEGELATCSVSPIHRYARSRGACPWCDLERVGLFLFLSTLGQSASGAIMLDIGAVESRLAEVPPLVIVPIPVLPKDIAVKGEPLEPKLRRHRRLWLAASGATLAAAIAATIRLPGGAAAVALAVLFALVFIAARPPTRGVQRARRIAMIDAEAAFEHVAGRWRALADMRQLERLKAELDEKLAVYRALPAKYAAERAQLEANKAQLQMRAYLDGILIAEAKIKGVGRKRKAMLLSYGIETALDIEDRLRATFIPKFGERTQKALFLWVYQVRLGFRFDATRPLDPTVVNELRTRETRERSDLERDLRGGPQALKILAEQRAVQRESFRAELTRLAEEAAKARADYRALRRF